ncbi:hypothetical protein [Gulosibacter hominis]|uniref:hypothetical protein n=1 Tax=Gulosibacter hominis TaxID=2770504 RepID=UPI00191B1914|nr:hypothetical protein [Gulosibacter hominis]
MTAATVNWEIYEQLRTLDISDESIPDAAIASQKFRLGQAASWARWGETRHDLAPITAHSREEFQALAPLTTAVVILGLNWGGTEAGPDIIDWQTFHTKGHAGDLRLSRSLPQAFEKIPHTPGEPAPAPYMTDVFKLVPTPDGAKLRQKIQADYGTHDHVTRCAELLKTELDICTRGNEGIPPLLITLGIRAYKWLIGTEPGSAPIVQVIQSVFGGRRPTIAKIHHSSASKPDAERTTQLIAALSNHSFM